jgi:hypothetical protein
MLKLAERRASGCRAFRALPDGRDQPGRLKNREVLENPWRVIGYSRASSVAVLGLCPARFISRLRRTGSASAAKDWLLGFRGGLADHRRSIRSRRENSRALKAARVGYVRSFNKRPEVLQHHTKTTAFCSSAGQRDSSGISS